MPERPGTRSLGLRPAIPRRVKWSRSHLPGIPTRRDVTSRPTAAGQCRTWTGFPRTGACGCRPRATARLYSLREVACRRDGRLRRVAGRRTGSGCRVGVRWCGHGVLGIDLEGAGRSREEVGAVAGRGRRARRSRCSCRGWRRWGGAEVFEEELERAVRAVGDDVRARLVLLVAGAASAVAAPVPVPVPVPVPWVPARMGCAGRRRGRVVRVRPVGSVQVVTAVGR